MGRAFTPRYFGLRGPTPIEEREKEGWTSYSLRPQHRAKEVLASLPGSPSSSHYEKSPIYQRRGPPLVFPLCSVTESVASLIWGWVQQGSPWDR